MAISPLVTFASAQMVWGSWWSIQWHHAILWISVGALQCLKVQQFRCEILDWFTRWWFETLFIYTPGQREIIIDDPNMKNGLKPPTSSQLPSWELTYPLQTDYLKMIFRFQLWNMLVPSVSETSKKTSNIFKTMSMSNQFDVTEFQMFSGLLEPDCPGYPRMISFSKGWSQLFASIGPGVLLPLDLPGYLGWKTSRISVKTSWNKKKSDSDRSKEIRVISFVMATPQLKKGGLVNIQSFPPIW